MRQPLPYLVLAAILALLATAPVRAEDVAEKRARLDYILHCSGCHGMDGSGHPGKGIPAFPDQVGYFAALPEGRAMLMQVPGLLNSGLNDERAAAVTTWLVRQFAGKSLPADFTPYTVEEARRYRASRPADINGVRNRLYRQIVESGYVLK
jgi:mono/diheme cytochrome c family protein